MTPAVEITRHAVDFYNALCRASFDEEHDNLNRFPEADTIAPCGCSGFTSSGKAVVNPFS